MRDKEKKKEMNNSQETKPKNTILNDSTLNEKSDSSHSKIEEVLSKVENSPYNKGTVVFKCGGSYSGTFFEGKFNGVGKLITKKDGKDETIYQGQFFNGKKNGTGSYNHANKDVYEGEFRNDKKDGLGVITYQNGNIYFGEWKGDQQHGKGLFTYSDGDRYEGMFQKGVFHGFGEYIHGKNSEWSNDRYKGTWKEGKRSGYGEYYFSKGNVYKGNWINGIRTGHGKFNWADGDFYKGNFVNNRFHGNGIYFFKNGDEHHGMFERDKFQGRGLYLHSSGQAYVGVWDNDERDGKGTFIEKDGSVSVRYYKKGNMVLSEKYIPENKQSEKVTVSVSQKDKHSKEMDILKVELKRSENLIKSLCDKGFNFEDDKYDKSEMKIKSLENQLKMELNTKVKIIEKFKKELNKIIQKESNKSKVFSGMMKKKKSDVTDKDKKVYECLKGSSLEDLYLKFMEYGVVFEDLWDGNLEESDWEKLIPKKFQRKRFRKNLENITKS